MIRHTYAIYPTRLYIIVIIIYYKLLIYSIGIGKSTLINEICLKWAMDKDSFLSKDYDLVIMIRLRAIQERTLQQAIIEAVGSEVAYDELLTKCHGEKCLIILEGLDEISDDWQQNDTMFCQLVKNTVFLSHANILVTSRPHACTYLYKDIKSYVRKIEIVGFGKPQIKEYAELYFCDSNTAEKFMEQVNNDPNISSLCYVPLCLNMVLECFKYNNESLYTTLTELYQSFIISKVDEHKKVVSLGTVLESDKQNFRKLATVLSDVPNVLSKRALKTIFLLSKLGYKSYFEWYEDKGYSTKKNPKIIYTNKDLAHCNITNSQNDACGLLKATNTLFATGNITVYSFNHLSVQEYFCALYISLLPEGQQLQLLKDHITDYPHMWPFYAGITKLKSSDMIHYLFQFLQNEQLENANFIDCKKFYVSNDQTIVVLNSIYEAQLSSHVCCKDKAFVCMPMDVHLYDCMSISYFMSIAPVTYLSLHYCEIGDQEAEMLARYKNFIPSLKLLDLSSNRITHKGMESVVTIVKSSTNLTHFSIARNPIGDDGVQLLLKFKHLIQLNVTRIDMTEVGTCALCECLKVNTSLQSLEISHNSIKDKGLTTILNNLPSILVRLIVSGCHLTYNGAVNIGKMLSINKALKYLKISSNFIKDDGISAISDGLYINMTLIQLVARRCGFHSKGAESIAKMLQANKTLKYLDISSNNIGDSGIKAVTRSIQTNPTLIQLKVFNCKSAGGIAKMLMVNKTLKELGITYNADTVTVLKTFRKSDCELVQLNINVDETDDSYVMVANYINKVINTAHYIKQDYLYYYYDSALQKRYILKVWLLTVHMLLAS